MATSSYPFAGQSTTETQYSRIFRELQETSVLTTLDGTALRVTANATGMNVSVAAGQAFVRGVFFEATTATTLTIAAASAVARMDTVVLRLDPAAKSIVLAVITGDTATGAPGTPTQSDTLVYELPLAFVLVPASAVTLSGSSVADVRPIAPTRVSAWHTGNRPTTARMGKLGYNADLKKYEFWNGSAWERIGGDDTGWLDLTNLRTGWNIPAGRVAQCRQIHNRVYFRGDVQNTGFTDGPTTFASLPAGVSGPAATQSLDFGVGGVTTVGRLVRVTNLGSVQAQTTGATSAYWSLSNITYLTD